ncbi:MAG: outer membrane protein assembly factor BamB [Proteobacteria bacterium]|nr:outer membrane protein assembly factor BamB [Pseudomonadota bacterium]MDA1331885.1 outer membrane protein assembly factor BamB [Pseudomonadota bacterium]
MKIFITGLAILSLLLAAACAAPGREPADLPKFEQRVSLQKIWNNSLGNPRGGILSPIAVADRVCGASARSISCFNWETGRVLFETKIEQQISGGVGAADRDIIVGGEDGVVTLVDASGSVKWESSVRNSVTGAPLAVGGVVVVRDVQGRLVALDRATGTFKWDFQVPSQSLILRANPGLAIGVKESIVAGFHGGVAMNLGSATGNELWGVNVSIPSGDNDLERISDVVGTPIVLEEAVCMATFQGRAACFDLEKGRQNWSVKVSAVGSLGFDSDKIFVSDSIGHIMALDRKTGALLWRNESFQYRNISGPSSLGPWVIVGDLDGVISLLDSADGSFAGRVKTDGSPILTNPLVIGDKVFVQTSEGNLYAFGIDQHL